MFQITCVTILGRIKIEQDKICTTYSDEGDTSSSSSEAGVRETSEQPAPPPSPIFPDINKNNEVKQGYSFSWYLHYMIHLLMQKNISETQKATA